MVPDPRRRHSLLIALSAAAAAVAVILFPHAARLDIPARTQIHASVLSDSQEMAAVRSSIGRRLAARAARHHHQARHKALAPLPSSPPPPAAAPPSPQPAYPSGQLTADQVGQLWLNAGGSAAAVATAECIALQESSDNTTKISPTQDYGLWQINIGNAGRVIGRITIAVSLDSLTNARDAVALSGNGTDWSDWTTHSACGV
jgi:Lysozyme like domain